MGEEKTVRQQAIVDSARRIIIEKGMEHLTVREIAKDLKITDGALYRHFKSKTEILSLLIDDIETTLLSSIDKTASCSKEPLQKLEDIFLSHLSYAEQRKGVSFIVINKTLSVKDKILQKKMFAVLTKYLKMIKLILKEGIKTGGIRNSINLDCASIAFLGMIQSLVTIWSLSDYKYPLGKNRLGEMFGLYKKSIVCG
ncbi:MAG: TetR/AcrR family transcriptional regulator [Candidatus Omnitrophota bacterium]